MYNHQNFKDAPYSSDRVTDGAYNFALDREFDYAELSSFYFVDSSGTPVAPSAGIVKFQVTPDGVNWYDTDGGAFQAAYLPEFPTYWIGMAIAGRFVLSGIAGAAGFRASVRQRNDQQQFPRDLMTSQNRRARRLRVDIGQTGFFEGREFRTFNRMSMTTDQVIYLRFTCPVDFILFDEQIVLNSGEIDHTAYRSATNITGTWSDLPVIGRNTMTRRPLPYYQPVGKMQILSPGGSFTGTDEVGPPLIPKAANATAQQTSVPAGNSRERGLSAGTYYLRSRCVSGPLYGVGYWDWEELP